MIYYTADQHFGHTNVIAYSGRPFESIEQMNEALIANWNGTVGADDTVYIVGDFAYRSPVSMEPVLRILKGTKHLILGNHDVRWFKNIKPEEHFASVSRLLEIDDSGVHVTLCHFPMLEWSRSHRGSVHIHGHIHNNRHDRAYGILQGLNAYNAGVDVNGFKPATLEQLKENKRRFCRGKE